LREFEVSGPATRGESLIESKVLARGGSLRLSKVLPVMPGPAKPTGRNASGRYERGNVQLTPAPEVCNWADQRPRPYPARPRSEVADFIKPEFSGRFERFTPLSVAITTITLISL